MHFLRVLWREYVIVLDAYKYLIFVGTSPESLTGFYIGISMK